MKHLFYLLLLTLSLGLASCGGNDAEDCAEESLNFSQQFNGELQNIANTATDYANEPTQANCESYKNAIREYVEALKSFEDCAREAGQLSEWNASLSQYESQIDSLC